MKKTKDIFGGVGFGNIFISENLIVKKIDILGGKYD
jgi:hypothetical protein